MKKVILIITMVLGLIIQTPLMAQRAYKEGNKIILDLTEEAGMPAGATTNVKKSWTGTPSNTSGPLSNNTATGTINETVYQKLEIAPSDLTSGSNWSNAFTGCNSANINGSTGWRLPTQRELILIYLFKPAIEALSSTMFASTYYWSATESNNSSAWCVYFELGYTVTYGSKSSGTSVRCVREIE